MGGTGWDLLVILVQFKLIAKYVPPSGIIMVEKLQKWKQTKNATKDNNIANTVHNKKVNESNSNRKKSIGNTLEPNSNKKSKRKIM